LIKKSSGNGGNAKMKQVYTQSRTETKKDFENGGYDDSMVIDFAEKLFGQDGLTKKLIEMIMTESNEKLSECLSSEHVQINVVDDVFGIKTSEKETLIFDITQKDSAIPGDIVLKSVGDGVEQIGVMETNDHVIARGIGKQTAIGKTDNGIKISEDISL
jgi:hypothetical protein